MRVKYLDQEHNTVSQGMADIWTAQYRTRRGDSRVKRSGMEETSLFSDVMVSYKEVLEEIIKNKHKQTQNTLSCPF